MIGINEGFVNVLVKVNLKYEDSMLFNITVI